MKKKFKVVIVGFGRMGRSYFRLLSKELNSFEVQGIVSSHCSQEDVKVWSTIDSYLESQEAKTTDVIINCLKTENHFESTSKLLKLKKTILVEKPLTNDVESALKIAEAAKDSNVAVYVSKPERFNPAITKLNEVIEKGWLGQPIHYSITRVGGYPSDKLKHSNVILDLAVHDFDLLQFIHGNFKVRSSVCHRTTYDDKIDTAEVLLVNNDGISASIHVNWITPVKIRKLKLTGTKGVLELDYILQTCNLTGGAFSKRTYSDELSLDHVQEEYSSSDKIDFGIRKSEPLKEQLIELMKMLEGNPSKLCTAQEAAEVIRLTQMSIEMGDGGISSLPDNSL